VHAVQEEDSHDDKPPSDIVRGNKVCPSHVHVYVCAHVNITVGVSRAAVPHVSCVCVSVSLMCMRLWA
jgi:hypothetical protein